ncbi:MAG: AMP-binding protein, partial [Microthrixaceae bacterium]|nr:AMP-binding protein [Microthrixaceae bacterium]
SIMLSPLPGVTTTRPGSCTTPFFGVDAAVLDEAGDEVGVDEGGLLAIRRPWPSMLRGIWGDEQRYRDTYWSHWEGRYYLPGDGARKDADGNFWIMGRIDDVLNVSGHRLSTMEIESALVSHPAVVEAAVVARPDDLTGEAICAFVIVGSHAVHGPDLAHELKEHVAKEIG